MGNSVPIQASRFQDEDRRNSPSRNQAFQPPRSPRYNQNPWAKDSREKDYEIQEPINYNQHYREPEHRYPEFSQYPENRYRDTSPYPPPIPPQYPQESNRRTPYKRDPRDSSPPKAIYENLNPKWYDGSNYFSNDQSSNIMLSGPVDNVLHPIKIMDEEDYYDQNYPRSKPSHYNKPVKKVRNNIYEENYHGDKTTQGSSYLDSTYSNNNNTVNNLQLWKAGKEQEDVSNLPSFNNQRPTMAHKFGNYGNQFVTAKPRQEYMRRSPYADNKASEIYKIKQDSTSGQKYIKFDNNAQNDDWNQGKNNQENDKNMNVTPFGVKAKDNQILNTLQVDQLNIKNQQFKSDISVDPYGIKLESLPQKLKKNENLKENVNQANLFVRNDSKPSQNNKGGKKAIQKQTINIQKLPNTQKNENNSHQTNDNFKSGSTPFR